VPVVSLLSGSDVLSVSVSSLLSGSDVLSVPVVSLLSGSDVLSVSVSSLLSGSDVLCVSVLSLLSRWTAVGFSTSSDVLLMTHGSALDNGRLAPLRLLPADVVSLTSTGAEDLEEDFFDLFRRGTVEYSEGTVESSAASASGFE
jgi:hypothetical protein